MATITVYYTYKLTFLLTGFDDYCFAEDRNLYHLKRQKLVKKVYNNGTIGYNLNGKFYSLKVLKPLLTPYIETIKCPF